MQTFLQSTDERNLYYCILNGLWGSKNNKLGTWQAGDQLVVYVNRSLAALFEIIGETFYDETPIWPSDIYPYRCSIRLKKIIDPSHRYSLKNSDTRNILQKYHTSAYGVTIVLTAKAVNPEVGDVLLNHVHESPEWAGFDAQKELSQLEEQIAAENDTIVEKVIEARVEPVNNQMIDLQESVHTKAQWYLAQLGRALSYDVWIPKADQGRVFQGHELGVLSRPELPSLPFNKDVIRIISYIDVIWFQEDHPTHLFEVEHTTSVYSGILRMSDLVTLIPSMQINMYICASDERRSKVSTEINRPTFEKRSIPLSKRCRFISTESLFDFMHEYEKLLNHLNVSVLNEISDTLVTTSTGL